MPKLYVFRTILAKAKAIPMAALHARYGSLLENVMVPNLLTRLVTRTLGLTTMKPMIQKPN
jgi:hypothetical protein